MAVDEKAGTIMDLPEPGFEPWDVCVVRLHKPQHTGVGGKAFVVSSGHSTAHQGHRKKEREAESGLK